MTVRWSAATNKTYWKPQDVSDTMFIINKQMTI
jgi:hypothetical protein